MYVYVHDLGSVTLLLLLFCSAVLLTDAGVCLCHECVFCRREWLKGKRKTRMFGMWPFRLKSSAVIDISGEPQSNPYCFACHCECLICVLIIGDSLDSNLIMLPDWDCGTALPWLTLCL